MPVPWIDEYRFLPSIRLQDAEDELAGDYALLGSVCGWNNRGGHPAIACPLSYSGPATAWPSSKTITY
ncbi:hypothetical protein DSL92_08265 [Billgrantia gudaonensis]|uniref:Uncharacterized protein n=1 Tax=Billgrantia gudaonensis TaxID=376427 RepID=A0A3S0VSC8_9GAMM|nr:hypothetical protein DSL92_08265 [Halomonas gudaonensis]